MGKWLGKSEGRRERWGVKIPPNDISNKTNKLTFANKKKFLILGKKENYDKNQII